MPATSVVSSSGLSVGWPRNCDAKNTQPPTMAMFSRCRPGSSSGLLPMRPCSLPNATIDPVKVTAPTNTPTNVSIWWMVAATPSCTAVGSSVPPRPTSTAAAPTKLCRMATSCGIDVISTRDASTAPIAEPTAMAPASTGYPPARGLTAVATAASTMPMMP